LIAIIIYLKPVLLDSRENCELDFISEIFMQLFSTTISYIEIQLEAARLDMLGS